MNAVAEITPQVEKIFSRIKLVSQADEDRWEYDNVVLPNLRATQLPAPYFWRIKNWGVEQRKVYDECKDLLQWRGSIIALVGPRGVGKTTIAAQLILDRAWDATLSMWNRRPPYRKVNELVARFKPLFGDFGSTKLEQLLERFKRYAEYRFLVVDEWHEGEELKMRDRVMTDLLDRRYAANNDTILISNQTPEEFIASTNESTISRLSEAGAILRCEWESFRGK